MCLQHDEKDFEEYITELFGTFKIGVLEFDAGRILRELDETAFNVGMSEEKCSCEGHCEECGEEQDTCVKCGESYCVACDGLHECEEE